MSSTLEMISIFPNYPLRARADTALTMPTVRIDGRPIFGVHLSF